MTDGGPKERQSGANPGGNRSSGAAVAARLGFFNKLGRPYSDTSIACQPDLLNPAVHLPMVDAAIE